MRAALLIKMKTDKTNSYIPSILSIITFGFVIIV